MPAVSEKSHRALWAKYFDLLGRVEELEARAGVARSPGSPLPDPPPAPLEAAYAKGGAVKEERTGASCGG